jgi:chitodextrinase
MIYSPKIRTLALGALAAALSGCGSCGSERRSEVPDAVTVGEEEVAPAEPALGPTPGTAEVAEVKELLVWADADPDIGDAPLTVDLMVEAFEEIEQPQFSWDFGDGSPPSTEPNPTHVYQNPGEYTVRVTVTDAAGNTGEDMIDILVEEPQPAPAP